MSEDGRDIGAGDAARAGHKPLSGFALRSDAEMAERARAFRQLMATRRTIRFFSDVAVPKAVIEEAIRTAGTAPSGANKQPWHFAVVSDVRLKRQIREAAEAEEKAFYAGRASDEWLADLEPLGTDEHKPFLESAPYLIVCFQQSYGTDPETGARAKHYYAGESAGIACGLLIAALHNAGLATLTHTPSPMGFLREILGRPKSEKPIMIVVAGRPAADATVPDIGRKSLEEISSWR